MKITIKDVAASAGVSITAVSLALNNKPGVSELTRQEILKTAAQLGYNIPKRMHLRNHEQSIVRVLKILRHGHTINSSHNNFIDAYVDGINTMARQKQITLEIETYGIEVPIRTIAQKMVQNRSLNDYLILGTELSEEDIRILLQTGKHVVFMDTFFDYIPADFVVMNNTDSVYDALLHLYERGHRDIGLIRSSIPTHNFKLREIAFHQVANDLGLTVRPECIIDVDSTFAGAHDDVTAYLDTSPHLPTGFFATNDIIALGCMKAFMEHNISIPDDVSLVAFDNLPMSSMTFPALTTIDVSKDRIGQNALKMLIERSSHKNAPPAKVMVGGKLIVRNSVRDIRSSQAPT